MALRLGLSLAYAGSSLPMHLVDEAERLGYDSVWCGESYGPDAVTRLAFIAGRTSRIRVGSSILQMPARAPAMTAMTAMTLDEISGGRFILGLGPSGPQVVEGWYGVPYGKPLTRTREYIAIIRKILAREAPLEHHGEHYQIPYTGPGASGLGKALKSISHGRRDLPIYTASVSPAGLQCAGECCDGVIPLWLDPERSDIIEPHILAGFAKGQPGRTLESFDIAPYVYLRIGADLAACRQPVKEWLALYIGGMGARDKNFYNAYARRLGYDAQAQAIQDLYLGGRKAEAAAQVPDALVDRIALIGPPARIRERLSVWKAAAARGGVGTMLINSQDPAALRMLAEMMG
ncbi:MAG: LLM class F420-dependent oxidoreductase [Gammaproteobacteria bacterium]